MHKDKKKKKKKSKILLKLFFGFCIVISILAGFAFGVCKAVYNGDAKAMAVDVITKFVDEAEQRYVLVIGVSEDIETELADTIMLCGYNPKSQDAFIVSVPRDTFVGKNKNNAKGSDKINSHYRKGIEDIKQEVEEIFDLQIDNYVVVKTSMLINIVDVIGGVDFEVPINMNYDDPSQNLHIHLEKGMQKIDGEKAEQLLRFRHNNDGSTYPSEYGNNDFGRMRTQREFIKAVIKQTVDVKNVFKANDLIDAVLKNIDTDLEKNEITSYLPYLLEMNIENIKMEQVPGEAAKYNGVWLYVHDKKQTQELITALTENFEK